MDHEIQISLTLDNAQYEALIAEAERYQISSPKEWLEAMMYREIAIIEDTHDAILSEDEFREFEHLYSDEDWGDDFDPEIPF